MLLDDFVRECVLLTLKKTESDEGGFVSEWGEGEKFNAFIAMDSSPEAVRGERTGLSSTFNVLVGKDVPIHYGDYFRDSEGGWTYRVITEPDMKQAPEMSSLDLKNFTAQREDAP